ALPPYSPLFRSGAHCSADGAAGILRVDQAMQCARIVGARRRQIYRTAQRNKFRIDSNTGAFGERHVEGADRSTAGIGQHFEKDETRIALQHFLQALGMRACPCADALHRHLFQRQLALLYQPFTNRAVRMPVLIGVTQSQQAAVFELHAPRALYLQEKCIEWIIGPRQYLAALAELAAVDIAAAPVRHYRAAIEAAAQAQAL